MHWDVENALWRDKPGGRIIATPEQLYQRDLARAALMCKLADRKYAALPWYVRLLNAIKNWRR